MIDVWPENWDIWSAWLELSCPWRYLVGMDRAVILGLDSAEILAALDLQGVCGSRRQAFYAGFRVIADAAVPVLNQTD